MGRPEAPLPQPGGPVRDLAAGLRRLRRDSGGWRCGQLARSANVAAATLARAASGHRLPSWEVTRAYVRACGGDPAQWRAAWVRAAEDVSRAGQPAAGDGDDPALAAPAPAAVRYSLP